MISFYCASTITILSSRPVSGWRIGIWGCHFTASWALSLSHTALLDAWAQAWTGHLCPSAPAQLFLYDLHLFNLCLLLTSLAQFLLGKCSLSSARWPGCLPVPSLKSLIPAPPPSFPFCFSRFDGIYHVFLSFLLYFSLALLLSLRKEGRKGGRGERERERSQTYRASLINYTKH